MAASTLKRSYILLEDSPLSESVPQLMRPMPDEAFLPYSQDYGFRWRYASFVVNPNPNRELNIGDH